MKASRNVRGPLLAVCLVLVAVTAFAQAQPPQQQQYQPQVGQAGKDVVWVPTPQELVDKMLDMAKVTPADFVIDLGSGDGRTVITAAKRGARALGIEYNPDMVQLSKDNAVKEGVTGKADFMKADLFEADFSKATVITMFLLPDINLKLRPKILDLKPGTRIVSNSFTMGDWEADETETAGGECSNWCTALFWIVPAKVEGTWKSSSGEVSFTQQYQMVTGTSTLAGAATPITDGRLRGDRLTFSAGGAQYSGKVNGSVIDGTVTSNGSSSPWTATRAAK